MSLHHRPRCPAGLHHRVLRDLADYLMPITILDYVNPSSATRPPTPPRTAEPAASTSSAAAGLPGAASRSTTPTPHLRVLALRRLHRRGRLRHRRRLHRPGRRHLPDLRHHRQHQRDPHHLPASAPTIRAGMRRLRRGLAVMTARPPAMAAATNSSPPRARPRHVRARSLDERWHGPAVVRPMIQLRSLLDGGTAMTITQADYHDPDRWWL